MDYEPGHDNDRAFDNYDQWKTSEPDEDEVSELYFLFAGDHYYPQGGISDLQGTFSSLHEARTFAEEHQFDWAHIAIVDRDQLMILEMGHDLGKLTGGWH